MTTILHPGAPHPLPRPGRASPGLSSPGLPSHRPDPVASRLAAGARPRALVPRTLEEASALAEVIAGSGLAPVGFDTPQACLIAILHGLELGLTPLAALQRLALIEGRPTLWGDGALALVRASGLCTAVREMLEGSGPGDWQAVCTLRRRGEARVIERRFSADDARRARLWGKPGPWTDYPQRMLQMRARAFALRDGFADVLGGLYLREELEGSEPGWNAPGPHGGPKPAPPPGPAPTPAPAAQPEGDAKPGFRVVNVAAGEAGLSAGHQATVRPNRRNRPRRPEPSRAPACARRGANVALTATLPPTATSPLTARLGTRGDQRPCRARRSPAGACRRQRRGHEGGLRAATPPTLQPSALMPTATLPDRTRPRHARRVQEGTRADNAT